MLFADRRCAEGSEVIEAFDKVTAHLERIKQTIQIPVVPFPELIKI